MERLVEPFTRGDSESPLRWTIKSTRVLTEELTRQEHAVSHATVATLLEQQRLAFTLIARRERVVNILIANR